MIASMKQPLRSVCMTIGTTQGLSECRGSGDHCSGSLQIKLSGRKTMRLVFGGK